VNDAISLLTNVDVSQISGEQQSQLAGCLSGMAFRWTQEAHSKAARSAPGFSSQDDITRQAFDQIVQALAHT